MKTKNPNKYPDSVKAKMIAPCGMNCALCIAFHREKKSCAGCLGEDSNKSKSCITCIIKNCDYFSSTVLKKLVSKRSVTSYE